MTDTDINNLILIVTISHMNIYKSLFSLMAVAILWGACRKTDSMQPVRLFRPVIAGELLADSNAILVAWQAIKAATSYTVQVSRDTFRTIDISMKVVDTTNVLIKNLRWDQLYQVQVRAEAADSQFNSRFSNLGAIKTPKFPTILKSPTVSDVTDEAIRVSWTNSGATVTSIKVLKASDSSLVKEVLLTATDVTNEFKIISGLSGGTTYIGMLYSGTRLRGSDLYTTKQPISGAVVDLRSITGRPSVLADTLPSIASGSTVILKRGETYDISSSISLNKAVKIMGGSDLSVPGKPVINMPANFNIAAGSNISFVDFEDVYLKGTDATSKYVFNINNASTIGRISFQNVIAESFRGVTRFQGGVNNTDYIVNNSVMFNLGGYGVITVDATTSKSDNISITNSTIYKADKIITSRQNSVTVKVENNTINEAPLTGNYLIDYNTAATSNVSNGVTVRNNIFGVGRGSAGVTAVRGIRIGAGGIIATNNYSTSDYNVTAATPFAIPDLIAYNRSSTQLWVDAVNGNFKIADMSFPGTASAGDPRWR
jgi:hypothetical protein